MYQEANGDRRFHITEFSIWTGVRMQDTEMTKNSIELR